MDAQVVEQDHGDAPTQLGTLDCSAQLGTERSSSTTKRPLPIEPTIPPVDESEAILLLVIPAGLDQPLPTTTPWTPHAGQGGVQSDLDLVLQVDVGPWQQPQQPGQVFWHLIAQQRIRQQIIDRWR